MERLTKEQIVRVLGQDAADDETILAIIDTGASEAEFQEAYSLLVQGEPPDSEHRSKRSACVSAVCDLLEELNDSWREEATHR
jgi:hypothetical protein